MWQAGSLPVGSFYRRLREIQGSVWETVKGVVMKYYFLALGTLVVVFTGCIGSGMGDGAQLLDKGEYHAPPAGMMQRPGPMVGGPGPGVMPMMGPPPQMQGFGAKSTQVKFAGPEDMSIGWKINGGFAENQLTASNTQTASSLYNFRQGVNYRLKLSNIPGRQGLVVYPTLQVYPSHPTTDGYLSHVSVPVVLSDEDLDQITSNNLVTKVVYLPDARYQELAIAGVETLVSTPLDPGMDPVAEADRRGTILAVLRVGNTNLEMPSNNGGVGPNGALLPGGINQISYRTVNGAAGEHEPPMPIGPAGGDDIRGVPHPMLAAGSGFPGQPGAPPIAGMGGLPSYGMPMTSTPIGLPGPPHIPLGGRAGLRSHTVRNRTSVDLPKPVDHMLIDVKHDPGLRLPKPVKYIQYKETHPVYSEGEVSHPNWSLPPQ